MNPIVFNPTALWAPGVTSANVHLLLMVQQTGSIGRVGKTDIITTDTVLRASGIPEVWKMCSRPLFILLQRAQFPVSAELTTTLFADDL